MLGVGGGVIYSFPMGQKLGKLYEAEWIFTLNLLAKEYVCTKEAKGMSVCAREFPPFSLLLFPPPCWGAGGGAYEGPFFFSGVVPSEHY